MSVQARRILRAKENEVVSDSPDYRLLSDNRWKGVALALVSTAENSSINWQDYYTYIEDINDGRGYTGGIVGFCSGTGDMLNLVQYANTLQSNNILSKWIDELQQIDDAPYSERVALSHSLLGDAYIADWRAAGQSSWFQKAQRYKRDEVYWNPAYMHAQADGLSALGLAMYYDVSVNHGPGSDAESFGGILTTAKQKAAPPALGGDEKLYLKEIIVARDNILKSWGDYQTDGRSTIHLYLLENNFTLRLPINWSVYGENFSLTSYPAAV